MMYVYYIEEYEDESIIEKIINNGFGIPLDDEKEHILSKLNRILIDGNEIKSSFTLDDYINMFDGDGVITLVDGIQIRQDDAIDALLGELYQPCDDGNTYADKIYDSKNPDDEIIKLINEFLLVCIHTKMDEIMNKVEIKTEQLKKQIESGKVNWE